MMPLSRGCSSLNTQPRSMPHTGALAKTRPVLAALVKLIPKVIDHLGCAYVETTQAQHGRDRPVSQFAFGFEESKDAEEQKAAHVEPERRDQ
jgi:hypothetical protein